MKLILQSFDLALQCLYSFILFRVNFGLRRGVLLSYLIVFKSLIAFQKLVVLLSQLGVPLLEKLQLILDIFQIGKTLLIDPTLLQALIQDFDLFIGLCVVSFNLSQLVFRIQQFSTYLLLLQSDKSKFFAHIFDFLLISVAQGSPFLALCYLLMQFLLKRNQISFRSGPILAVLGEILELSASFSTMVQFILG